MNKEYIQVKADDISKLLYEVYDVPSGICEQIKNMVQRLEAIDNSNPSEVLKYLEEWYGFLMADNDTTYSNGYENEIEYNRRKEAIYKQYYIIKQALLKAQEPKHYLKWEDLEFDNNAQVKKNLKVKLGDNIYSAFYYYSFFMDCETFCIARDTLSLYITDKQFFNDLHLERVEE